MTKKPGKVNLDLIKKLVSELEKSVETADSISTEDNANDVVEYIAELARASGLAGVVMQEAHMLVKDLYTLVRLVQGPTAPSESEVMAEIEKIFGGPGAKRNTN
jgi:hypothetical protein